MAEKYYEIDKETFAISIYDGVNPEPFWFQPDYPNGDKFDTYQEAESWAKIALDSHNDIIDIFPPNGKNEQPTKKPSKEEIVMNKLSAVGLSVNELKSLLGLN